MNTALVLVLLLLVLIARIEAACTGTNAFCSLISNEATCLAAGCARVNGKCGDPESGRVACASIASQTACVDGRCIWRDDTGVTSESGASTTRSTSFVPVTTATNSVSNDSSSDDFTKYIGMICVIVVFVSLIFLMFVIFLVTCLRRQRASRALYSFQ